MKYNKWFMMVWLFCLLIALTVQLLLPKGEEVVWLNERHHPVLDLFFRYVTELGNGWTYLLAAFFLAWYRLGYGILALLCFSFSGLSVQVLKRGIFSDMPRPLLFLQEYELHWVTGVKMLTHHSFPSGHTASAFSLFFLISLYINNQRWGVLFAVLAALVGFSRIYLSLHFLVDVMAGSVIGVVVTMITCYLWYRAGCHQKPLMKKSVKDVF